MTDRELLELAAKAAGIDAVRSRLDDPMNQDFLVNNSHRNEHQASGPWNPLTDDGDALRLAVGLGIRFEKTDTFAVAWGAEKQFTEPLTNDPYAATRRAITRAAAEMGKAKCE
jgi:hypothetical protein